MTSAVPVVVPMRPQHAEQVLAIYRCGIETGDATFETAAPPWAAFDAARLPDHRWVALDGAAGSLDDPAAPAVVLGWAACSPVSTRPVYAGVVEHSVYVARSARGRGVGRALLAALIDSTEAAGIWTLQSGIFPQNTASLALHTAAGFRVVGVRERVGLHHGAWRDVVFVERRSAVAGC